MGDPFNKEVPVEFTLTELWAIERAIPHEIVGEGMWRFPPSSLELNHQLADAIYACVANALNAYTVMLDMHACLIIDHEINMEYKDEDGNPVGMFILLKTFGARRAIRGDEFPEATGPELTKEEVMAKMAEFTLEAE